MSPQTKLDRISYAAFRLRFRAYIRDFFICLAVFVLGGLSAGIVFENSSASRVVAFLLVGAFIMGYEPFMVALYGGTFGHRSANIRVVRANTSRNLSLWRAAVRALVKWYFGLFSFMLMFCTKKRQSLHDLIAGAEVRIHDPQIANAVEVSYPPSAAQRKTIISVYVFLVLIIVIWVGLAIYVMHNLFPG